MIRNVSTSTAVATATKAMGISEANMVCKMRTELSDEETTKLPGLIDEIALEKAGLLKF